MKHPIPLKSCSTSWVLSCFADEAGPTLDEQIAAVQRAGLKHIDLRSLDGLNISALPLDHAKTARAKLDDAGIKVGMLGSPLGKIDIADDFKPDLAKLEHLGKMGEVFSCPAVRVFSYYNKTNKPAEVWEKESIGRLRQLRDRGAELGLVLYHENERHIFGDPLPSILKIAAALRDPDGSKGPAFRLIFDFDNYNQGGQDPWECWLKLRDLTDGFHLKDSDKKNLHVPIGTGAGKSREILTDALSRGWKGPLSLEPHLQYSAAVLATGASGDANQKFSDMSAADCFHHAAEQAKVLLGQIKAPVV